MVKHRSHYLFSFLLSFLHTSSADMCIAIAISLLMILICAMATYGAYKVSSLAIRSWAFLSLPYTCITCAAVCKRAEVMILTFL